MFLQLSSQCFLKNANPSKKLFSLSFKKIIILGALLQLISVAAYADRLECRQIPITYHDPSSAYDELTGTFTVITTPKQKYTEVCYTVPDTQPGNGDNGGNGVPARPKMPRPPYCDTLEKDRFDCKDRVEKLYDAATASCPAQAVGGAAVGTGAGFGTQIEKFGTYGRIASGAVAVVGAATTAWGSTGCTSGPAKTRDNNLPRCDFDADQRSKTCAQFK